jgi:hypothetical protein
MMGNNTPMVMSNANSAAQQPYMMNSAQQPIMMNAMGAQQQYMQQQPQPQQPQPYMNDMSRMPMMNAMGGMGGMNSGMSGMGGMGGGMMMNAGGNAMMQQVCCARVGALVISCRVAAGHARAAAAHLRSSVAAWLVSE